MTLNFNKHPDGLMPAIVQDYRTLRILMVGYMNEAAWALTHQKGYVTFYSRSRQALWTKGASSGNFLQVIDVRTDCDADCLLIQARPVGPVCHTGADTCFNEQNVSGDFLFTLESIIAARRETAPKESYTASLFAQGINKMAQKVGEEAVEVVIEAKDENRDRFLNETADLLYHLLVLMCAKDVSLQEVCHILAARHR